MIEMGVNAQKMLKQFFGELHNIAQEDCNAFARNSTIPFNLETKEPAVDVRTSPFQGTASYTCFVDSGKGEKSVVQFRKEEQHMTGIAEAHHLFGLRAPPIKYVGRLKTLHVYSSPFIAGKPLIDVLMEPDEDPLSTCQRRALVLELAEFCSAGAKLATGSTLSRDLDDLKISLEGHKFDEEGLMESLTAALDTLKSRAADLESLPLVLSHQDLSPFNYLVNDSHNHINAVLDWDTAAYKPVGSNFHFLEDLFGTMFRTGFVDCKNRAELEIAFYDHIQSLLADQGFEVTQEQLHLQKAVGIFQFWIPTVSERKNGTPEKYLKSYMERLKFLR